jgi:hypothetical protein
MTFYKIKMFFWKKQVYMREQTKYCLGLNGFSTVNNFNKM